MTAISDFGCQIWWKQQKSFENLFQKLQNSATRKILGAFKSSPCSAMELESALISPAIRLQSNCRKYALRITTLSENHPIRQRTPMEFPPGYGTEQDIDETKHLNWNSQESQSRKKHPTQLIKILSTISEFIPHRMDLEDLSHQIHPPWKIWPKTDIYISKSDKKTATKEHLLLLKDLLHQNNNVIIYTDGSKLDINGNLGAGMHYMYGKTTGQKSWSLGTTMEVYDAELFAIKQALKWSTKQTFQNIRNIKDIWIFADNQAALQKIQSHKAISEQDLASQCQQSLEILIEQGFKPHIHWVPGHEDIKGNELADEAAKLGAKQLNALHSERFTSCSYVMRQIKAKTLLEWNAKWENSKKGRYYKQFDQTPTFKIKEDFKQVDKLTFSTFVQMKMGHGYFKDYLVRLPDYDSRNCHGNCHKIQNPEHLLTKCLYFKKEQRVLKNQLYKEGLVSNIKMLFTTKQGIKAVLQFLKTTRVGTRKWLLGEVNEEEGEN